MQHVALQAVVMRVMRAISTQPSCACVYAGACAYGVRASAQHHPCVRTLQSTMDALRGKTELTPGLEKVVLIKLQKIVQVRRW